MSDKLVNEKELKRRYGIMVLGVFRRNDKKRAFGFVDKWLDKMEGVSGREMEDSRTFEVVAANALNYMEQDRAADVILSSERWRLAGAGTRRTRLYAGAPQRFR